MIVDPNRTRTSVLPYEFALLPNGKISIKNIRGQIIRVSRGEVQNILQREDLDVHRRRMYEHCQEIWNKQDQVQQ